MYPNLKLQLWKAGIRQNRLAQMLAMDETTLSRIVNGFRTPSEELKHSIAALLDCESAWLFQTEECRPPREYPSVSNKPAAQTKP
jgi:transcriptional regulator with XRE-family HTH domain